MAALGRLSAAIAHEIRQPLTAMAGAVKELARLVPLEEDEKHLVNIVSRESERLESHHHRFSEVFERENLRICRMPTCGGCWMKRLTLIEKKPEIGTKYRIARAYNGQELRARVDASKIKQVFWNLCDNALRAMPEGGTLTVRHGRKAVLAAHRVFGYGHWTRRQAARQNFRAAAIGISKAARGWDSRSCIRSFRPTADESA